MRRGNLLRKIEQAKKIHNNKYDYSWVLKHEPNSVKDKIKILCPLHGYFTTTLDGHINGRTDCPKCAGVGRITEEEYLREIEDICRQKNYTTEKTHYTNSKTKVTVTCHNKDVFGNEHGDFLIRPDHLRNGCGCPKCSHRYKPTTKEWIALAEHKHGVGRYDYSQMGEYTGNPNDEGLFMCHEVDENGVEHGQFKQKFRAHLNGSGCPICGGSKKLTYEECVSKFRQVHGNRYSYDNFELVNARTKGWITCQIHGDFLQTPYQHMKGCGCPLCKNSVLEERLAVTFDANLIYYETWNKYPGLGNQTIDYFLPQKRLYIECQGEQHYVPTKFTQSTSDEEALEDYKNRVILDKQKYDAVTADGYEMIYYTDPTRLFNKEIDVFGGWYTDKKVFVRINSLLDYIGTLPNYDYTPKEKAIRRKKTTKKKIHWTYELCKEEAAKYTTRTEFQKGNQPAYVAARREGWLNDFMGAINKPRGYWNNKERVLAAARECTGARDMYKKYPSAYSTAARSGWTKELQYKEKK